jgi:hypothetical protein
MTSSEMNIIKPIYFFDNESKIQKYYKLPVENYGINLMYVLKHSVLFYFQLGVNILGFRFIVEGINGF